MRVFISGQKFFGQQVFKLCQSLGHEIVGVSAPAWAGDVPSSLTLQGNPNLKPDRLRSIAELNEVPWMPSGQLTADTLPEGVDLIIAAHSYDFIGKRTRLKARIGAIGYHPSLLPIHRGRDAIRWAIKMGERVTGGSVFWLNDTVDGGPIAAQDYCFIKPGDTATRLWERDLLPMGLSLLKQVITDLSGGVMVAIPQDTALATWEPSIEQPPLHRPDLLMLGPAPAGIRVINNRDDYLALHTDE